MNDLISRQAAIDALGEAPKYKQRIVKTYAEGRNDQWFDDVTKLSLLPSEQPQRKKGKWIKLDAHAHLADHKCSACGQECYVPTCMGDPMYDFCPNCGARMEGEEHD